MVDVRPTKDAEEFEQALLAIGHYFGMEAGSEDAQRFARNLPVERTHAAYEDENIVGGAGGSNHSSGDGTLHSRHCPPCGPASPNSSSENLRPHARQRRCVPEPGGTFLILRLFTGWRRAAAPKPQGAGQ